MFLFRLLVLLLLPSIAIAAPAAGSGSAVEFRFRVPPREAVNPFARELAAEVKVPGGAIVRLPAYYRGGDDYTVRVFAAAAGDYTLVGLKETLEGREGRETTLRLRSRGPGRYHVKTPATPAFVRIDPAQPDRFTMDGGAAFVPVGMNLAWAEGSAPETYYRAAFQQMAAEGLNWSRVWMAHWGSLNLDWLDKQHGESPAPGQLDLRVADRWDAVIAAAEASGIRLQIVLHHHGQLSTRVNSNWAAHPWNAANPGGFLKTPTEFFTSPEALRLTRQKLRYIIARWGYSPAVLAWELFNEVHYTDAIYSDGSDAVVAAWHAEMADYIRSLDVNRHLVTTSSDDLRSGVYVKMDYLQPHVYAPDMLANVRLHPGLPAGERRPVFYGEHGDERMTLQPAQVKSAVALVPPVWASLGGRSTTPGQTWFGQRLIQTGRISELGAFARVLRQSGFAEQGGLTPFDVAVAGDDQVPLLLRPGHWWGRRPNAEVRVPNDGREPAEYGNIPAMLVGREQSIAEGFPTGASFQVDVPTSRLVRIRLAGAGPAGARLEVRVDGGVAASRIWSSTLPPGQTEAREGDPFDPVPAELTLELTKGSHRVEIVNVGGPDVVGLEGVDFGLTVPRLAALGRRNAQFALIWVWSRHGVFAVEDARTSRATLHVENVAAGLWEVTWWDSLRGSVIETRQVQHGGGTLALPTPEIARHAAVTIRQKIEGLKD